MKEKYRKIVHFICLLPAIFVYLLRLLLISGFCRKKIFILNTPLHGNMGDQAILLAEKDILKDTLPNYKIIVVPNKICKYFTKEVAKIVGTNAVCLHGGGYLGDLWPDEDDVVMRTIELLCDNKILFFPQTFCCNEVESYFIKNRQKFENCKHLVLFARDYFTYNCLKKHLKNKVMLAPDIVLYEKRRGYKKKKQVTICLRNDIEKTMNSRTEKNIIQSIGNTYSLRRTDMVMNRIIHLFNRKRMVRRKMREIGVSQLLITDRLHGMIFAYLTMTPCLMFDSKSPKIRGVYEWIKGSDYIVFHDNNKAIREEINEMIERSYTYNYSIAKSSFAEIKKELIGIIR